MSKLSSLGQQAEAVFNSQLKPAVLKRVAPLFIGAVRRTGLKVRTMERGHIVCELPFKGNVNHVKSVYAGSLFTLAEFPGGVMYLSSFDTKKFLPIVAEMTIKFIAPATDNVLVEVKLTEEQIQSIEAEALEKGKANFDLNGELKTKDGTLVATTVGHYQLRSKRRPKSP